jgi:flagellar protein FliS
VNSKTPLRALAQYRRVDAYGSIENAGPHRLVELLYDALGEALVTLDGAIERTDLAAKSAAVTKAAGIIDALRASLDLERGGELGHNLDRLYDYMGRKLTAVNLHGDVRTLRDIASVNDTLRSAWKAIPTEAREGSMAA